MFVHKIIAIITKPGLLWACSYSLPKYFLLSINTLGANSIVPTIVGITINAKALSIKFIAMSIDIVEATIIINT